MAEILLSEAEKTFVLHGIEENFRCDGRTRLDYRPMEVETDIVSHASGSARLRLANTDILVGVKTEIDTPLPERPREGKLEFFVDCSANATPAFEGRGGEELGTEISNSLATAYQSSEAFDLTALCILPGQQCWKLYVDILILECGGNLFDAVSLAVKAALYNTRVPKVKAASMDGGTVDLQLSDDPFDCCRLDVSAAPCLVTLCKLPNTSRQGSVLLEHHGSTVGKVTKVGSFLDGQLQDGPCRVYKDYIGDQCAVDPTLEEEMCSNASVVVAVTESGLVTSVFKTGVGSFHPETLVETLKVGQAIGLDVNKVLKDALQEEEAQGCNKQCYGFLK